MSRSSDVWDNAAAKSFLSSLRSECIARKVYRTRNQARADVFDYIIEVALIVLTQSDGWPTSRA